MNSARSVAEIMIVESHAAASNWRTFRDVGLRERKNGNLPRSWLRFAQRNKARHSSETSTPLTPSMQCSTIAYIVEAGGLPRRSRRTAYASQSATCTATRRAAIACMGRNRTAATWQSTRRCSPLSRRMNCAVLIFHNRDTTCIAFRGT